MQPKVSMVVPCYNKVNWIRGMFDSVLAQNWDNIELILVNDGSTDGTCEIISEYEPRFRVRGYEVIIVDQDNQGVAAAVKHGLMRASGKYVCMPDCDDVLDPEYVSAMAGLLMVNAEIDCIICATHDGGSLLEGIAERSVGPIADGGIKELTFNNKLLEAILLRRVGSSICRCMFRMRALAASGLPETIVTEPRIAQEFQVWIALSLHHVRILHLRQVLYHYNRPNIRNAERDAFISETAIAHNIEGGSSLILKTLKQYGVEDCSYYMRLRKIAAYDLLQQCLIQKYKAPNRVYIQKMLTDINDAYFADRPIALKDATSAGTTVLSRFFSNYILGFLPKKVAIRHKPGGRIIACAALGTAAGYIMSGLLASDIRPDIFWDAAAMPGDQIDGIPVMKPYYSELGAKDTVLALMKNVKYAQEVKDTVENLNVGCDIWFFYDILDYLADFFFQQHILFRS